MSGNSQIYRNWMDCTGKFRKEISKASGFTLLECVDDKDNFGGLKASRHCPN